MVKVDTFDLMMIYMIIPYNNLLRTGGKPMVIQYTDT